MKFHEPIHWVLFNFLDKNAELRGDLPQILFKIISDRSCKTHLYMRIVGIPHHIVNKKFMKIVQNDIS